MGVAFLACGAWLVAGSPQQRPTFRAGANFVTVDVYPQRDGRIVEGMTAADFDVSEDGKPQKIEFFEFVRIEPGPADSTRRDPNTQEEGNALAADARNRVFVLYLDSYHVTVSGSFRTRKPLVDMLSRLLAPNDLFGVTTPLMRPKDLVLGKVVTSINDQLTKFWPWGERQTLQRDAQEDFIAQCFDMTPPPRPEPWWVADGGQMRLLTDILIERHREDLTLSSLQRLVPYLGSLREARTVLLVFTDGWLLSEPSPLLESLTRKGGLDRSACNNELLRLAQLDNWTRMRGVVDLANKYNVSFYPVAPGGLQGTDSSIADAVAPNRKSTQSLLARENERVHERSGALRDLADNTNGIAVVDTNDIAAGLARITNDVSAYYLLGYYSTNSKFDGKLRQIQVKVKPLGIKVKARRGYLAPKEGDLGSSAASAPARPSGPSPVDDAIAALARVRSGAELLTYGVATGTELQVVTEIAGAQLEAGKWSTGADVQATVTAASGALLGTARGRIEPATRGALLHLPLPAGSNGPWLVRVTVTGAGDSLDDRTEIQPSVGAILGEAVMFRATPASRSPLRPVADFQFRRTERVHIEWPILEPLDRREARVLDRKGQPLGVAATLTEREVLPGAATLAADINLAPLAEGDYLVEITAGSGTKTIRKLVAFRVLP